MHVEIDQSWADDDTRSVDYGIGLFFENLVPYRRYAAVSDPDILLDLVES